MIQGEDKLAKLIEYLLKDNRIEEIRRVSSDVEYRKRLYKEYGIK